LSSSAGEGELAIVPRQPHALTSLEHSAAQYEHARERLYELERGTGLLSALSLALRTIKSSDGGSAGWPENRFTTRSKEPHRALTGVERARKAARTST